MGLRGKNLFVLLLVGALAPWVHGWAQTVAKTGNRWNPAQFGVRRADYTGPAVCITCHTGHATQKNSEMGLSLLRPLDAQVLAQHPSMSFKRGPYTYTLRTDGGKATFTAADAHSSITEPVFAVVGPGRVFQAYLIQHDGDYYRVPIDYFAAQDSPGLDIEADPAIPATLKAALGQKLSMESVRGCFQCHSPTTVMEGRIDMQTLTPGIHCETCHGPGARHVTAARAGRPAREAIFNPAHLRAEEKTALCNECHVSAARMRAENPRGVRSVVSPEYRLMGSRCWNASDPRITCTACHDPHSRMITETAGYDSKCMACHAVRGGAPARADQHGKTCPVGVKDCAGCHMPRTHIPNNPILFTDHRIRIPSADGSFPE